MRRVHLLSTSQLHWLCWWTWWPPCWRSSTSQRRSGQGAASADHSDVQAGAGALSQDTYHQLPTNAELWRLFELDCAVSYVQEIRRMAPDMIDWVHVQDSCCQYLTLVTFNVSDVDSRWLFWCCQTSNKTGNSEVWLWKFFYGLRSRFGWFRFVSPFYLVALYTVSFLVTSNGISILVWVRPDQYEIKGADSTVHSCIQCFHLPDKIECHSSSRSCDHYG